MNIIDKEYFREQQSATIVNESEKILKEMGNNDFYEMYSKPFLTESTDSLEKCYVWLMEKYYLEHANKNEYFLDVGCGTGNLVFKMERYGYNSSGIEPSSRLSFCYKLEEICRDKNVKFYPGIGEVLPFRSKWFDVVNSTMVLEMARDPVRLLGEMLRVGKVVTGIIHMDDLEGSPYHSWHMTEERIKIDLDWMKNSKKDLNVDRYEIEYFNEGHSKCAAFIMYSNDNEICCFKNIPVDKMIATKSVVKEWEDSYYEAILKYGKKVVENPVSPILVHKIGDEYKVCQDGTHRINALKRTNIKFVRVGVL